MAAGPRWIEVGEDPLQQLPLKQPQRLRRQFVAAFGLLEALLGGQPFDRLLNLPPQQVELIPLALLEILAQRLHVDQRHLGGLHRLLDLS